MGTKVSKLMLAIMIFVGAPQYPAHSQGVHTEKLYQTEIGGLGRVEAALRFVSVQGDDLLIIASRIGNVVAVDPATGTEIWRVTVPTPPGESPVLDATPRKVGEFLFVAYGARADDNERQRHLVAVIDLSTGTLATSYPTLELSATKPGNDGAPVVFNPPTALSRAALVNAGRDARTEGMLYVSFGNLRDVQPWHGWIFEIDIDAWKQEGPDAAIRSVFLTTPESDCPGPGNTQMICGGGVWNLAGPRVVNTTTGYELLVTTGNGELNLNDRNYAQSVLRLTKGLNFDPECDPNECAAFDPISPSDACLRSCKNIFIPRLMPGDPALQPASGRCDGKTFLECLAVNDWDLGANGALQINLRSVDGATGDEERNVIVQPGKDGGLYLFDALNMGLMYDRDQIVAICGTPADPCGDWSAGMIRAQPVATTVDGQQVVIVPTFMKDNSHPAGVVARKILTDADGPYFEPMWEAPPFSSPEARQRFRNHPSLAFLTTAPDGEPYVWVVDTTGQDTLFGIRVADGTIVVRQLLQGTVDTVRPAHHNGVIYVVGQLGAPQVLEAFRIQY